MIQLGRNGVEGYAEPTALAQGYREARTFRLPQLIPGDLLDLILSRLESTLWTAREHGKLGVEAAPEDPVPVDSLNFLMNRPEFLEAVRQISGIPDIKGFFGRIYRLADSTHYDAWHGDCNGIRLLGVSINLGRVPYAGGVFRLRERGAETILCELPNTGPGDAICFQLSKALEHMVTPVEGTIPKTAFAGWFVRDDREYFERLTTNLPPEEPIGEVCAGPPAVNPAAGLSRACRLRRDPDVLFHEDRGEALLLSMRTGTHVRLDAIGTRIWHLLGENALVSGVIAALTREFDVTEEVCSGDVLALLERLRREGLLIDDQSPGIAGH